MQVVVELNRRCEEAMWFKDGTPLLYPNETTFQDHGAITKRSEDHNPIDKSRSGEDKGKRSMSRSGMKSQGLRREVEKYKRVVEDGGCVHRLEIKQVGEKDAGVYTFAVPCSM